MTEAKITLSSWLKENGKPPRAIRRHLRTGINQHFCPSWLCLHNQHNCLHSAALTCDCPWREGCGTSFLYLFLLLSQIQENKKNRRKKPFSGVRASTLIDCDFYSTSKLLHKKMLMLESSFGRWAEIYHLHCLNSSLSAMINVPVQINVQLWAVRLSQTGGSGHVASLLFLEMLLKCVYWR